MEQMKWVEEKYKSQDYRDDDSIDKTAHLYVAIATTAILGQVYQNRRGHWEPEVYTKVTDEEMTQLPRCLSLEKAEEMVERRCFQQKALTGLDASTVAL